MKKNLVLISMLCVANVFFAQLRVNDIGTVSIGDTYPMSFMKLRISDWTNPGSYETRFGIQSNLTNYSSMFGARFDNQQGATSYGVHVNNNTTLDYSNNFGFYAMNTANGGSSTQTFGAMLNNNINCSGQVTVFGVQANNSVNSGGGTTMGLYASNSVDYNDEYGTTFGVYSSNSISNSENTTLFGLYSSNSLDYFSNGGTMYGVWSSVSGGGDYNSYSGHFMGGKVWIGYAPNNFALEVDGYATIDGVYYPSDERLKTEIKPLVDEKERLFLLQGKSYLKKLRPIDLPYKGDSLANVNKERKDKERVKIATPEYGYLAQEFEAIFPDLVKVDADGYYSVNYIGLIPIIVEALKSEREDKQKLQTQIDEQREQLKQLVKLLDIKKE